MKFDYREVESLINGGVTDEVFDKIYATAKQYEDESGEAKTEDQDGDFVRLEAKNEDVIEYERRSTPQDNDGIDDGLFAKRIKRFNGVITVEDIYAQPDAE